MMGEIADSLINGEFDCITGEYIGEHCGYPRTFESSDIDRIRSKRGSRGENCNQFNSKARQSVFAIMKARDIPFADYQKVVHNFLRSIPKYKTGKIGNLNMRYKIIYTSYRNEFKKFVSEYQLQKTIDKLIDENYTQL